MSADRFEHTIRDATPAVVVMGVSGSGKSTVAEALARHLNVPFLEGDAFHSAANVAKMRAGVPLNDEDRTPWLDDLGAAIAHACRERGAVAACSALKRIYRDRLRSAVGAPLLFVYLAADHDALVRRLQSRQHPYMPITLLDSQFADLQMPGADEADVITIPPGDLEDTLRRVLVAVEGLIAAT